MSKRKKKKTKELRPVKFLDLEDSSLLTVFDFLSFGEQYTLSKCCKSLHTFIFKRKNLWKYINILDFLDMCSLHPKQIGKITDERIKFGFGRIHLPSVKSIVLPRIDSLDLLFPIPPKKSVDFQIPFPKLCKVVFLIDCIEEVKNLVNELIRVRHEFPINFQVVVFEMSGVVIDVDLKKIDEDFRKKIMELKGIFEENEIKFNLSFCRNTKCKSVVDLKDTCGKCNKRICSKCIENNRCQICLQIHCIQCIKTYCVECPDFHFVCTNCKQDEYDECFACESKFCDKHENCLTECYNCEEFFCSTKKCVYQCDGCDDFTCNSENCGLLDCQFCSKRFCKICVDNNVFVTCEGCSCKMCEKCNFECKECLALVCKWCNNGRTCCKNDIEDHIVIDEVERRL